MGWWLVPPGVWGWGLFFYVVGGDFAGDRLLEGDEGFGAGDAVDHLDLVVEQVHEVFVVASVEFDEHGVGAGGEVAFHDFGDFFEFGDDIAICGGAFEVNADVSAGGVAEYFGVDLVAGAGDNVEFDQALDALVDCGTRYAATNGHVRGGDAGVAHNNVENLTVEVVDFFHKFYVEVVFWFGLLNF